MINLHKNDSRAPFTLAMLAMDMRDFQAAEKYFKKSIEVIFKYQDFSYQSKCI